jgi:hypothetical protein
MAHDSRTSCSLSDGTDEDGAEVEGMGTRGSGRTAEERKANVV